MKNKALIWTVTVILALPVPISLITIPGSVISLANVGMLSDKSFLLALAAVISMLLAGTYSVTYFASTINTFRQKKIKHYKPFAHCSYNYNAYIFYYMDLLGKNLFIKSSTREQAASFLFKSPPTALLSTDKGAVFE